MTDRQTVSLLITLFAAFWFVAKGLTGWAMAAIALSIFLQFTFTLSRRFWGQYRSYCSHGGRLPYPLWLKYGRPQVAGGDR